jgi:putative glutamine amidotransferase
MNPRIGITVNYVEDDQMGINAHIGARGQKWQALADDYVTSVLHAGGIPLLIPVVQEETVLEDVLDSVDGLLISGGGDASPLLFGNDVDENTGEICEARDRVELELLKKALRMENFPVLGICRGCQMMNLALGGTLDSDIDVEKYGNHFLAHQRMQTFTHRIRKKQDSRISAILGDEDRVNSYHHQCVKTPGAGVQVTAWDFRGVPECIEVPGRDGFTLGVQWHPEGLACVSAAHQNIFRTLTGEAQKYRERREKL